MCVCACHCVPCVPCTRYNPCTLYIVHTSMYLVYYMLLVSSVFFCVLLRRLSRVACAPARGCVALPDPRVNRSTRHQRWLSSCSPALLPIPHTPAAPPTHPFGA